MGTTASLAPALPAWPPSRPCWSKASRWAATGRATGSAATGIPTTRPCSSSRRGTAPPSTASPCRRTTRSIRAVTRSASVAGSGWRVTLSNRETRNYRGVPVAGGHLWDPALPGVATAFTGRSLHSSQYTSVEDIEGRVQLVGCGNSGCDLEVDAAQPRLDVSISIRRGQVFQPKTLFARPRTELSLLNALPPEQQNMVMNLLRSGSRGAPSHGPGSAGRGTAPRTDLILEQIEQVGQHEAVASVDAERMCAAAPAGVTVEARPRRLVRHARMRLAARSSACRHDPPCERTGAPRCVRPCGRQQSHAAQSGPSSQRRGGSAAWAAAMRTSAHR